MAIFRPTTDSRFGQLCNYKCISTCFVFKTRATVKNKSAVGVGYLLLAARTQSQFDKG